MSIRVESRERLAIAAPSPSTIRGSIVGGEQLALLWESVLESAGFETEVMPIPSNTHGYDHEIGKKIIEHNTALVVPSLDGYLCCPIDAVTASRMSYAVALGKKVFLQVGLDHPDADHPIEALGTINSLRFGSRPGIVNMGNEIRIIATELRRK